MTEAINFVAIALFIVLTNVHAQYKARSSCIRVVSANQIVFTYGGDLYTVPVDGGFLIIIKKDLSVSDYRYRYLMSNTMKFNAAALPEPDSLAPGTIPFTGWVQHRFNWQLKTRPT